MGAVDLVVQVESPGSVASGLQRIGRAGHQRRRAVSVGKLFPKYRGDLVEAAVVVRRMYDGAIEETTLPAQAAGRPGAAGRRDGAMDRWHGRRPPRRAAGGGAVRGAVARPARRGARHAVGALPLRRVRRAAAPRRLGPRRGRDHRAARGAAPRGDVGRHDPRPRPLRGVHRRATRARRAARRRARRGDGLRDPPGRDVHARLLDVARRVDITRDQVLVDAGAWPAGQAAVLARRRAGAAGRGRARRRRLPPRARRAVRPTRRIALLRDQYGLDALAATNLVQYLADQQEAGGALPTDTQIVVERFRDEIGDWRVCILSPFGGRVHAPWALAIEARARERLGLEVQTIWSPTTASSCGCRTPTTPATTTTCSRCSSPRPRRSPTSSWASWRTRRCSLRASASAQRGRCCCPSAARAGARRCGSSASSAADLLAVAGRYGSFPILLETYRECLRDVFDVPALRTCWRDVAARRVRVTAVETAHGVAVRVVAAVRLRRGLHVRGRRAPGGAPRIRRWPWTASCSPSCSAATSCAT